MLLIKSGYTALRRLRDVVHCREWTLHSSKKHYSHPPIHCSNPSVLGFKTVSISPFFFCLSSSINTVSNNTWVKLASVSVSHPFFVSLSVSFSSSLYNVRLSFQPWPPHYPSPPIHFFFLLLPNSHLHYSPPRLTILFSVSVISKVFSLDTAMTSRLHYNKYSYYSPSVFLFPPFYTLFIFPLPSAVEM